MMTLCPHDAFHAASHVVLRAAIEPYQNPCQPRETRDVVGSLLECRPFKVGKVCTVCISCASIKTRVSTCERVPYTSPHPPSPILSPVGLVYACILSVSFSSPIPQPLAFFFCAVVGGDGWRRAFLLRSPFLPPPVMLASGRLHIRNAIVRIPPSTQPRPCWCCRLLVCEAGCRV